MAKQRVGIVFGGKSAEHEVSLQSAKNILEAIDKSKYEVVLLGIDKQGEWHLNDASGFLLNADNPALIALNRSGENVALVPGSASQQLITRQQAQPLSQLDVIFPIVHGTLGEDGSLQGLLRMANLPFVGSDVLGSAVSMDKDFTKRLLRCRLKSRAVDQCDAGTACASECASRDRSVRITAVYQARQSGIVCRCQQSGSYRRSGGCAGSGLYLRS